MNKHIRHLSLLVAAGALVLAQLASAHSRLLQPAARTSPNGNIQNTLDGGGLNFDDPCGPLNDIPPGAPTAAWPSGSDQTVTVDHVVEHGSETYRFFISVDGNTFTEVQPPTTSEAGAINYVTGGVGLIGTGDHKFRIKLPTLVGNVVLRYTDGEYFSCADITLIGGGNAIFMDGFESGGTDQWEEP